MVELSLILELCGVLVFLIATIFALKLYKGNFGISAPYFVMACFLLLGGAFLSQVDLIIPNVTDSSGFSDGLQILQILAGVFIIIGLYKIFEARFATESYFEIGRKK